MNCWEFMKCGREAGGSKAQELGVCPAWPNHGHLCAHLLGTLCGDGAQMQLADKLRDCEHCDFFKSEHYDRSNPQRFYLKRD